jgi:hypothetical protein
LLPFGFSIQSSFNTIKLMLTENEKDNIPGNEDNSLRNGKAHFKVLHYDLVCQRISLRLKNW